MSTPNNNKQTAPKTPGFFRGLFGPLLGANDDDNADSSQTLVSVGANPNSTTRIRRDLDLISGTPQIRRRDVTHENLTLSSSRGRGLVSETPSRISVASSSPWQSHTSFVPSGNTLNTNRPSSFANASTTFQIGVSYSAADRINRANEERPLGRKLERREHFRPRDINKRFKAYDRGQKNKEIAQIVQESVSLLHLPSQNLLASTVQSGYSTNGYQSFCYRGRFLGQKSRVQQLPVGASVVASGNKHRLNEVETTNKRHKVTFNESIIDSRDGASTTSVTSLTSSPSRTTYNVARKRPKRGAGQIFDSIKLVDLKDLPKFPSSSGSLTLKPFVRLPRATFDLQPTIGPSKVVLSLSSRPPKVAKPKDNLIDKPQSPKKLRNKETDNTESNGSNENNTGISLGELFKRPKGAWNCKFCFAPNYAGSVKCLSCEQVNDDIPQSDSAVNSAGTPAGASAVQTSGMIGSAGFSFGKPPVASTGPTTQGSTKFSFGVIPTSSQKEAIANDSISNAGGFSFGSSNTQQTSNGNSMLQKVADSDNEVQRNQLSGFRMPAVSAQKVSSTFGQQTSFNSNTLTSTPSSGFTSEKSSTLMTGAPSHNVSFLPSDKTEASFPFASSSSATSESMKHSVPFQFGSLEPSQKSERFARDDAFENDKTDSFKLAGAHQGNNESLGESKTGSLFASSIMQNAATASVASNTATSESTKTIHANDTFSFGASSSMASSKVSDNNEANTSSRFGSDSFLSAPSGQFSSTMGPPPSGQFSSTMGPPNASTFAGNNFGTNHFNSNPLDRQETNNPSYSRSSVALSAGNAPAQFGGVPSMNTPATAAPFAFGSSSSAPTSEANSVASNPPFSFGSSSAGADSDPSSSVPFAFGSSNTAVSVPNPPASAPIAFGSSNTSAAPAPNPSAAAPFAFASSNTSTQQSATPQMPSTETFAFGSSNAATAPPAFQFGAAPSVTGMNAMSQPQFSQAGGMSGNAGPVAFGGSHQPNSSVSFGSTPIVQSQGGFGPPSISSANPVGFPPTTFGVSSGNAFPGSQQSTAAMAHAGGFGQSQQPSAPQFGTPIPNQPAVNNFGAFPQAASNFATPQTGFGTPNPPGGFSLPASGPDSFQMGVASSRPPSSGRRIIRAKRPK